MKNVFSIHNRRNSAYEANAWMPGSQESYFEVNFWFHLFRFWMMRKGKPRRKLFYSPLSQRMINLLFWQTVTWSIVGQFLVAIFSCHGLRFSL
jgi:hypothetical protein